VLRYSRLELQARRLPQAEEHYTTWFVDHLRRINAHIEFRKFICDGCFTIADFAVGYALHLGQSLELVNRYTPQVKDYLARLQARLAFQKASARGAEQNVLK
jgi:glutathione S-transferase